MSGDGKPIVKRALECMCPEPCGAHPDPPPQAPKLVRPPSQSDPTKPNMRSFKEYPGVRFEIPITKRKDLIRLGRRLVEAGHAREITALTHRLARLHKAGFIQIDGWGDDEGRVWQEVSAVAQIVHHSPSLHKNAKSRGDHLAAVGPSWAWTMSPSAAFFYDLPPHTIDLLNLLQARGQNAARDDLTIFVSMGHDEMMARLGCGKDALRNALHALFALKWAYRLRRGQRNSGTSMYEVVRGSVPLPYGATSWAEAVAAVEKYGRAKVPVWLPERRR